MLWVIGVATSLLTAIYMFRLVFLTFHGERAAAGHAHDADGHGAHGTGHGHAAPDVHDEHGAHHGGHLHDAPPAMAAALLILAVGSVVAGYVGVPHAASAAPTASSRSSNRASTRPARRDTARRRTRCRWPRRPRTASQPRPNTRQGIRRPKPP